MKPLHPDGMVEALEKHDVTDQFDALLQTLDRATNSCSRPDTATTT